MEHISLYALGIFVGSIISYSIIQVKNWDKIISIVSGLLSAAVSGAIFIFIDGDLKSSDHSGSIYFYPIGLANSLVWVFTYFSKNDSYKPYFLIGVALVTAFALSLIFSPYVRSLLP